MRKVWSPSGYHPGIQHSWVGKDESLINYNEGLGAVVTKGKVGVDNQPSSIQEGDDNVVAGNDIDVTNGVKFSAQIKPLTEMLHKINVAEKSRENNANLSSLSKNTQKVTDQEKGKLLSQMKEITDRQEQQHAAEDAIKYNAVNDTLHANSGKDDLPDYAEGKSTSKSRSSVSIRTSGGRIPWAYRFMPGLVGMGAEAYMYDWWRRNPIQYHSTYARNPYERLALRTMSHNKINPYDAIRAAQDAERRGEYRIDQSGGLTGAQRYLAKVAGTLGNAQNMANIYQETNEKNAALRNQYAEAAAKIGEQDAQRAQHANQHDWDDYVAAHGRKTKGIETHIAGFVNQLNHMYANEAKYKMWRDSVAMYQQQLDDENAKWLAAWNYAHPTVKRDPNWNKTTSAGNGSKVAQNSTTSNPYEWKRPQLPSYQDVVNGGWNGAGWSGIPSLATPPYVGGNRSASTSGNNQSTNNSVTYSPNYFGSWPNQAYRFGNLGNGNTGNRYYNWMPIMNKMSANPYWEGRYAQAYPNVQTGFDMYPNQNRYSLINGMPVNMEKFGRGWYDYGNGWNFNVDGNTNFLDVKQNWFNVDGPNGWYRPYSRGKDRKKGFRK